jgi:hypothetical protein
LRELDIIIPRKLAATTKYHKSSGFPCEVLILARE